jgi:hypothetical protein
MFIWFFIASLWSYLHLDTVFIYLTNLGIPEAKELSRKIKYNYGYSNDYLHTSVHARLILKYLLGIAM